MKYTHHIRCCACNALFVQTRQSCGLHYSGMAAACKRCGNREMYQLEEAWVSTARLANPLTWFSGYYLARDGQKIARSGKVLGREERTAGGGRA